MARMTTKLTTALAGLALASLPALAGAQSSTSQQPDRPQSQQQQQRSRTADQNSPEHHLNMAKQVLNQVNPSSLQGEARTQITELKRNFNQLENAWRNQSRQDSRGDSSHATGHTGTAGTTGTSGTTSSTTSEQTGTTSGTTTGSQRPRSEAASPMAGNDDWKRHYQAIDSMLDNLLGSEAASSGTSGSAGTTGTAGTTGATPRGSANVEIDASLRSKLTEFRGHLDKFYAAAMSQHHGVGEEDRASANPQSGVTGSMTGTTGTSGSTSSAGTATGTSGQATTGTQTHAAASASQQADSAAIARLTASIDEMLRASSTSATATTGTSGTTTSGTAGTSGTSASASANATVCVDREKLEQLRRDIQALNRNR